MLIPSIDIMNGRAVQLRQGRDFALDGGDPLELLDRFSVVGEVAVIDLDAALARGSNTELIRRMARIAPIRVGGGIRDVATARAWLDSGAHRVILGTAAVPDTVRQLPRERVIAALDAQDGEIVVQGWRQRTARSVDQGIIALREHVSGFLLTQVEREGMLRGIDLAAVERAVRLAGPACRVTAAGGIATLDELAALRRLGADAQVGMALYTGRMGLGQAFAAAALESGSDTLVPTVVADEHGQCLGLAWSNRESIAHAVDSRRGIYWSRSRNEIWEKGATSLAVQRLVRVAIDCDADALQFTVSQSGAGFCHRDTRSCFGNPFDLGALQRTIARAARDGDPASGTVALLRDRDLLSAKIIEEATELARATSPADVTAEAADLLYFALVRLTTVGVDLAQVVRELELRSLRLTRRPMERKDPCSGS